MIHYRVTPEGLAPFLQCGLTPSFTQAWATATADLAQVTCERCRVAALTRARALRVPLRTWRYALGWTQETMATALLLHPDYYAAIERGAVKCSKRVLAQAQALVRSHGTPVRHHDNDTRSEGTPHAQP